MTDPEAEKASGLLEGLKGVLLVVRSSSNLIVDAGPPLWKGRRYGEKGGATERRRDSVVLVSRLVEWRP